MYDTYDNEEFQWRYYMLYRAGFFLSTFAASSFTPESLELPDKFRKLKEEYLEEYNQKLNEVKTQEDQMRAYLWIDKKFKALAKDVLEYFREHRDEYPIIDSFDSGAKGSPDDLRKLLIAVGLSINAKGEINDVIGRSHAEGLTPTQFFNYSSQAIVSQYKKSNETATPGYLIRQLNTVTSGIKLSNSQDCGTKRRLKFKIINKELLKALEGKMYSTTNSGGLKQIQGNETDLVGTVIYLRSPLYCEAEDGICVTCYNPKYVARMQLEPGAGIGILASTSQAGILTAMTLKSAHTGLSLDQEEVDLTEDIYNYSE
jgi:hypothetical protein